MRALSAYRYEARIRENKKALLYSVPNGYWSFRVNRIRICILLEEKLNITEIRDWYTRSRKKAVALQPNLFKRYGFSLYAFLKDMYPDYDWVAWHFCQVPRFFWGSPDGLLIGMRALEEQLNIKKIDDWYEYSRVEVANTEMGAKFLNAMFCDSVIEMLRYFYPEREWDPLLLKRRPLKYWQEQKNASAFLKSIEKPLKIKSPLDWLRISKQQIKDVGGASVLNYWPGVITETYPEIKNHEASLREYNKKAAQRHMFVCTKSILPMFDVVEEYEPGFPLQIAESSFDVFVHGLNIALEFQGAQHYSDFPQQFAPANVQEASDIDKLSKCKQHGITLVPIPYWWNTGDTAVLAATILHYRPDVRPFVSVPCDAKPLVTPTAYFNGDGRVSIADSLMQPTFRDANPLLPNKSKASDEDNNDSLNVKGNRNEA